MNNIDFRQLVAPEDKDLATTQYLNRREQLDTPEDYQLMVIRKDDTRRRTRINVTLFTDVQGNKYTVGHVSDITEATEANRLQEAIFKISQTAHQAKDLESLYLEIREITGTVLDVTNFYIALQDREKEVLTFPCYIDQYDEKPQPQKKGRGLTEYVIRTGSPLFVDKSGIYDLAKKMKSSC